MTKVRPVILCGGSGTRLWPRSRHAMPKPFLPLVNGRTPFQSTLDHCADPQHFAPPLIVTGHQHLEHVHAQIGARPDAAIIVEPEGKNTAPAIALAAARLPRDTVMLVCPSDHHIADAAAFRAAAAKAGRLAEDGWLVAMGDSANRAGDGLRLYLPRRTGRRRFSSGPVCREARPRNCLGIPRRRPMQLEWRHLRLPRRHHSGRA